MLWDKILVQAERGRLCVLYKLWQKKIRNKSAWAGLRCGQVGMVGRPETAWWIVRCRPYKALVVSETEGRAGHYKLNSTKSSNTSNTCCGPRPRSTPPIHRHYSTHRGKWALGCALKPVSALTVGPQSPCRKWSEIPSTAQCSLLTNKDGERWWYIVSCIYLHCNNSHSSECQIR